MSDVIHQGLERLAPKLGAGPLRDVKRLSGGASQETWSFDVGAQGFILRRAPNGVPHEASAQAIGLATEAAVIETVRKAGAPAPEVVHVCTERDGLGAAYIMRRLAGETIARKILRDDAFAHARKVLPGQCGAALQKIHATDKQTLPDLPVMTAPGMLDRYEEIYRSFNSPRPIFDFAIAELRRRMPEPVAPVLVHGDFRLGNLMIDETGLVAALDWEITHFGDPAEDLSWICMPSWRFGGVDKPVGGFGAVEDLLAGYHAAGGDPRIDADRVRFWTMFGSLRWGVMCMTMYRVFESGMDRSVERAAIGRRSSETELDLMLMFAGKL
ncbi:MAG: phosphotransferase [Alphaproteobacteria bacterium]|nr:phosphotransferase [Alphaproteobacteria bacterium]